MIHSRKNKNSYKKENNVSRTKKQVITNITASVLNSEFERIEKQLYFTAYATCS